MYLIKLGFNNRNNIDENWLTFYHIIYYVITVSIFYLPSKNAKKKKVMLIYEKGKNGLGMLTFASTLNAKLRRGREMT